MDKTLTYEQAVERLEAITAALEQNNVSLDEALALFSEGTELAAFCTKKLEEAKQKITVIEKD